MGQSDLIDYWLDLSPTEFEEYVADLWYEQGYDVERTQDSNDDGVDVVAYPQNPMKSKEVIQAKRNQPGNTVGSPTVRDTAGAAQQYNAPNAVLVTTAEFTSSAIKAAEQTDVELIDGNELERLHRKYMRGVYGQLSSFFNWFQP